MYKDSLLLMKNTPLKSALMFLTLLVVVCLILYPPGVRENVIEPFVARICNQAAFFINFFGQKVYVHSTSIIGTDFSVDVKNGCNAVYEITLLICAIVVYPSKIKYKLLGILIGSMIVYVFNLLRVVGLFLIGVYDKDLFNTVHNHVSQSLFIFVVVVFWLLWASRTREGIYRE